MLFTYIVAPLIPPYHNNTFLLLLLYSRLDIATNIVAFATKLSGEVANLRLIFTFALLKQNG